MKNKQSIIELNKEFVKLVAENPELPIKVFVDGECGDGEDGWFVGEVYDCKVTEVAEYGDKCYERDDVDVLEELIYDKIQDDTKYQNLTVEEMTDMAKEELEWLGWERVILLKVSV